MELRTGDRQLMKELNIALVLNMIRQEKLISRAALADRTGLGRSTVTGIINILLKEGLVQEVGSAQTSSGRKPVLLTFNDQARYAVGIKLGPLGATVALLDTQATLKQTEWVDVQPNLPAKAVAAAIAAGVESLLHKTGVPRDRLLGAGLVLPGVIDPATGTAIGAYFLGWANEPVRPILEEALALPVWVDNDANAVALAEALWGAGRGVPDLLALTIGVGIGAGLVIGGRIHRGTRFSAGEIGHTCLQPDGPLCGCGRRGCLEALAGDGAIIRRARELVSKGRAPILRALVRGHSDLVSRDLVVQAAKNGDEDAIQVLAEAGRWLGVAVANAINLMGSARVVIGGEGAFDAGDLILGPMRETMQRILFPTWPGDLTLLPGALGETAWVKGAAALVLADAFQIPLHTETTAAMARQVGQNG